MDSRQLKLEAAKKKLKKFQKHQRELATKSESQNGSSIKSGRSTSTSISEVSFIIHPTHSDRPSREPTPTQESIDTTHVCSNNEMENHSSPVTMLQINNHSLQSQIFDPLHCDYSSGNNTETVDQLSQCHVYIQRLSKENEDLQEQIKNLNKNRLSLSENASDALLSVNVDNHVDSNSFNDNAVACCAQCELLQQRINELENSLWDCQCRCQNLQDEHDENISALKERDELVNKLQSNETAMNTALGQNHILKERIIELEYKFVSMSEEHMKIATKLENEIFENENLKRLLSRRSVSDNDADKRNSSVVSLPATFPQEFSSINSHNNDEEEESIPTCSSLSSPQNELYETCDKAVSPIPPNEENSTSFISGSSINDESQLHSNEDDEDGATTTTGGSRGEEVNVGGAKGTKKASGSGVESSDGTSRSEISFNDEIDHHHHSHVSITPDSEHAILANMSTTPTSEAAEKEIAHLRGILYQLETERNQLIAKTRRYHTFEVQMLDMKQKYDQLMQQYQQLQIENKTLEKEVIQLDGETHTIDEYVLLYRAQRALLLDKAERWRHYAQQLETQRKQSVLVLSHIEQALTVIEGENKSEHQVDVVNALQWMKSVLDKTMIPPPQDTNTMNLSLLETTNNLDPNNSASTIMTTAAHHSLSVPGILPMPATLNCKCCSGQLISL